MKYVVDKDAKDNAVKLKTLKEISVNGKNFRFFEQCGNDSTKLSKSTSMQYEKTS